MTRTSGCPAATRNGVRHGRPTRAASSLTANGDRSPRHTTNLAVPAGATAVVSMATGMPRGEPVSGRILQLMSEQAGSEWAGGHAAPPCGASTWE